MHESEHHKEETQCRVYGYAEPVAREPRYHVILWSFYSA